MSTQAGDPFVANPSKEAAAKIDAVRDSHRQPAAELEPALDALAEFEADEKAEAEAKAAAEPLSINEVRDILKVTAQAVEDATVNLAKAKEAYQIASALEVKMRAEPTLVELNAAMVKVTATEVSHKRRAMKALSALGYGTPKMKQHPPLFGSR